MNKCDALNIKKITWAAVLALLKNVHKKIVNPIVDMQNTKYNMIIWIKLYPSEYVIFTPPICTTNKLNKNIVEKLTKNPFIIK